jgi:hypothetical protein
MKKLASLAISLAALGMGASPVLADQATENHASYVWVVGATTPTDTAMAPDGSTIAMRGRGTLVAGPGNTVTGGGTFHKSNGASGTFTATALVSFVSYGSGSAQGLPANLFGGEAKIRVTLSNGETGVLTIVCKLGSPPPSKVEGIQLILGSGVSNEFTMQDGGTTVFVRL